MKTLFNDSPKNMDYSKIIKEAIDYYMAHDGFFMSPSNEKKEKLYIEALYQLNFTILSAGCCIICKELEEKKHSSNLLKIN